MPSASRHESPKRDCHLSQQDSTLFSELLLALRHSGPPRGCLHGLFGSSMEEGLGWSSSLELVLVTHIAKSLPLWKGSENMEKGQQYQRHRI